MKPAYSIPPNPGFCACCQEDKAPRDLALDRLRDGRHVWHCRKCRGDGAELRSHALHVIEAWQGAQTINRCS